MAFITRVLSDNEKLLGIARVHWIHLAKGALWLVMPILAWNILIELLGTYVYPALPAPLSDALHMILYYAFAGLILMGMVMFWLRAVHFMVAEMALTTKRVIYKTGWLFVQVREVDLEELKAADIDNGVFGRFLNYGYLILDSRFVGTMNLASISHPYAFLRLLNDARGELKQDSVNVILEGHESLNKEQAADAAHSVQQEVEQALEEVSAYKPRYATAPEQPAQPQPHASEVPSAPPTVFAPHKMLHDRILQSFMIANFWR